MAAATYSASHVDSATTFYFSDSHEIGANPRKTSMPEVLRRHVCIAEHSELQPTSARLGEDDHLIHRPLDVAQ